MSSSGCATRSATRQRGALARARLRERYDVVLVDEFQDTDPVQWDIMRGAFDAERQDAGPHRRSEAGDLRLPRRRRAHLPQGQGDVCSPSGRSTSTGAATRGCWTRTTRCSTARSSVKRASPTARSGAAPGNVEPRLSGAPVAAPLAGAGRAHGGPSRARLPAEGEQGRPMRDLIARDLAAQTVELLESAAGDHDASSPDGIGVPPAAPGRHRRAGQVQQPGDDGVRRAPAAADVPAVIGGAGSVFATEAGRGMAAPARGARAARGRATGRPWRP